MRITTEQEQLAALVLRDGPGAVTSSGIRAICLELGEAWDAAERYRVALRHIADHYDAETSATVPADPERVGLPGPHQWDELSHYIEGVLGT